MFSRDNSLFVCDPFSNRALRNLNSGSGAPQGFLPACAGRLAASDQTFHGLRSTLRLLRHRRSCRATDSRIWRILWRGRARRLQTVFPKPAKPWTKSGPICAAILFPSRYTVIVCVPRAPPGREYLFFRDRRSGVLTFTGASGGIGKRVVGEQSSKRVPRSWL